MDDPAARTRRVLVVDDEPMVSDVISRYLRRDGFEVEVVGDGAQALETIKRFRPDIVVLDVMLPSVDGLTVLEQTRSEGSTPVILLSARRDESDRVLGLELGADDYVVKPFSPRELAARVRSVLRRSERHLPEARLEFSRLTIDTGAREVLVEDRPVELTPKEFDLLAFLASSPRQVFSRAQLLEHVWDSSPDWQDPATVTVHIRRLRQKIESDPNQPNMLTTVWGVGYRFEP